VDLADGAELNALMDAAGYGDLIGPT
jgi:hypothetical protein